MGRPPKSGLSLAVLTMGEKSRSSHGRWAIFPFLVPSLRFLKPNKPICLAENEPIRPVINHKTKQKQVLSWFEIPEQAMSTIKNCRIELEPCNFYQVFLSLWPRLMGKNLCTAVARTVYQWLSNLKSQPISGS